MRRCLRDPTFSRFDTIPECDRQTHTQTHRHTTTANTALSIASRGKNLQSSSELLTIRSKIVMDDIVVSLLYGSMHNRIMSMLGLWRCTGRLTVFNRLLLSFIHTVSGAPTQRVTTRRGDAPRGDASWRHAACRPPEFVKQTTKVGSLPFFTKLVAMATSHEISKKRSRSTLITYLLTQ